MSPPRRRSIVALAAPVVVTMLALGPLAATLLPAPAIAAADGSSSLIQVRLATLQPVAPQPDDTLVLTGTLTNVSDTPVSNLELQLEFSAAVGSRSEFDAWGADPDGPLENLGSAAQPTAAQQTTLAPGASERFLLSLALNQDVRTLLALPDAWQVRELGIAVTGDTGLSSGAVGQLRTFLPWAPRDATGVGSPTRVAWVWPLVDRPHRTASGVWFDDTLAPELAGGGRLSGLLAAGSNAEDQSPLGHDPKTRNVPVTWTIDPMLVSDAQAMAAGYRVQATTGTSTGTGTDAAKQWMTDLRAAVTRTDAAVIPLPYGDPDVVAAARARGFATTIGVASTAGRSLLQQALGASQLAYGWPSNGLADQRGINLLQATGDTTIVLSDAAVPVIGGPPPETPSAHTVVSTNDGPVTALLSDSGLDADVQGGVNNPDGSRLSLQQFLAETLMIQAEQPADQRDVVVAPNRRWDPTPAYAAALLSDTGKLPWVQPVSLQTVRRSPLYTKVMREPLTYPPSGRQDELSPSYLSGVSALRSEINDFNAILPPGTPQIRNYTTAEQQTLSSAWRDQGRLANTQLSALTSAVSAQMAQVRITSHVNSYVTLTSHGGTVPVTIANNLGTPVSVIVKVEANQRLSLSGNGRVTVVPAHEQVLVRVHAAAKTSGVFPVQVRLLTPKGRPYGPSSVQLFVRSTVYGTITLVITGAATAALMIAVIIRLTRRAMAARRSTAIAAP